MRDRPIRVALVNHTASLGGAELALLSLVASFDRDRVAATVVVGEDGPLVERLTALGLPVEIVPLDARLTSIRKDSLSGSGLADPFALARSARAVAQLRSVIRRLDVQIVHTNSLKAHALGGVAGRLAGTRVIWHVRDRFAVPYLPAASVRAVRLAARRVPHRVFAVSSSAAETVGRDDVTILRQGVALPPLQRDPKTRRPLRVGIVGRIAPWKGQDVFLAAAARIAPEFPEAEFVVAGAPLFGEDDFERELRQRARCSLLDGRVQFLGFRDDVWEVYRGLDVAVHASTLPEPYGNVILEAMASRTALVASDAGGAAELVSHERTGLLVPPADAGALADAVARLLRDDVERKRLAAAGRRHVEETYSLDRDARDVERVYAEEAAA